MNLVKTMRHLLGLDETQPSTEDPLKARVSIEARELDHIIEQLRQIRSRMNYQDIINAADIQVTSQEVLRAAEHAKMLAHLFIATESEYSADKIKERFINAIKNAGKRGYYSAIVFCNCCTGIIDKETYVSLAHNSRIHKVTDYYTRLIESVNMYVAIRDLQRQGFKFRVERCEFIISIDETVVDELKVEPKYLSTYKASTDIEPLLKEYEINARKLYDEFPEFFGPELKRRFNFN